MIHGDLGPWNIVTGDDRWVILDWDGAAPGRLEWELAYVLVVSVPLLTGMCPTDDEIIRRIRVFACAYEMSSSLLERTLELLAPRCRATFELIRRGATAGDAAFVKLSEQGHDILWSSTPDHVEKAAPQWSQMLIESDPGR